MGEKGFGGAGLVAAGATLWGLIGLFTRELSALGLAPMEIVAVRLFGAAALLSALALVRERAAFSIRLRDLWMFVGTGVCSFVFFNWCYFSCIEVSSLASAAVLLYTAPSFVMVLSAMLFHEALTRRKVTALLVTMAGCVLVTGALGAGGMSAAAVALGLGSGLGYALYSIFGRVALGRYSAGQVVLWTNICGGLAALALVDVPALAVLALTPHALLAEALLVVVSTILPLFLYTKGLSRMEAGRASVVATLEPVVATLVGTFAFAESLAPTQVVGIALVIGAVILVARK